jgi:hypothetical protein
MRINAEVSMAEYSPYVYFMTAPSLISEPTHLVFLSKGRIL